MGTSTPESATRRRANVRIVSPLGQDTLNQERKESLRRAWARLTQSALSILGFGIILSVVIAAVFAPWLAPYPEDKGAKTNFDAANQPPSLQHPVGTDQVGRDILSRVLFGARISLMMGFVVLSIAISIGVVTGLVAGYFGGIPNAVIMRTTDVFLAVPPTLLALAVTAALKPTLWNAMIAIAFGWWTWYTRIVQGEVLSVKEEQFIEASEALGAKKSRIILGEIFPNIISPLTVKATLDMGFVILVGAGLAFLGLGARPPTPAWGAMVAYGQQTITLYWWQSVLPGLAIAYTVLGFNFLGDGLRDIFDVEVQGGL